MDELELLDWKRQVFGLYAEVRAAPDPEAAWRRWREARDGLLRGHPQSPLPPELRAEFVGLPYFDYDPALRVLADVEPADGAQLAIGSSGKYDPRWVCPLTPPQNRLDVAVRAGERI